MATAAKKKAAAKPAPAKKARVRASVDQDDVGPRATKRSRVRVDEDDAEDVGAGEAISYFAAIDKPGIRFVSAGAAVIDCMLGGGWALGRVANIVGDRSAGKTLLAIEAIVNFFIAYILNVVKQKRGLIRYNEVEAAFDEAYAQELGMPIEAVEFVDQTDPKTGKRRDKKQACRTVEELDRDLEAFLKRAMELGVPSVYVIDSLDALSDEAEQGRDIGDGSYGGSKPKKLGEMFRRRIEDIEAAGCLLIVISQLRDKIGVTFGEKQTRSGGRALDFYASHIVWLAQLGKIKKTMSGVERSIGVEVKARVKKNKVGLPFRECEYPILFGWGVDDLTANVEWLLSVGAEELLKERVGMSKAGYKVRIANLRDKGGEPIQEVRTQLRELVIQEWQRIETGFLPKSRKYG